jgi:DNA-binding MarR family transcriptional regulator
MTLKIEVSGKRSLAIQLFRDNEKATNKELADLLGVQLGTAKALVRKMIDEGLIWSRVVSPGVSGGRSITVLNEVTCAEAN